MKKSILSILAVCATIAVSAQTVAVTQASASSNTSVGITQIGASALTLNQLGVNGAFAIEQAASANSNEITINQMGD
jgi:polyisoprenoid-binding protein YceI